MPLRMLYDLCIHKPFGGEAVLIGEGLGIEGYDRVAGVNATMQEHLLDVEVPGLKEPGSLPGKRSYMQESVTKSFEHRVEDLRERFGCALASL